MVYKLRRMIDTLALFNVKWLIVRRSYIHFTNMKNYATVQIYLQKVAFDINEHFGHNFKASGRIDPKSLCKNVHG